MGILNADCPGVAYGLSHCKILKRQEFLALILNYGNYDGYMPLSGTLDVDLAWWKINGQIGKNPIRTLKYAIEISSDASLSEWGTWCNGKSIHDWRNNKEKKYFLNYLKLFAVFDALNSFSSDLSNYEIFLRLANTTTIANINRAGSIQFLRLSTLSRQIWEWCKSRKILIFASCIS